MDSKQPQLSRLENQSNFLLSTLRRYVEALGGQFEMTAVFDKDLRVRLTDVS